MKHFVEAELNLGAQIIGNVRITTYYYVSLNNLVFSGIKINLS